MPVAGHEGGDEGLAEGFRNMSIFHSGTIIIRARNRGKEVRISQT